MAICLDLPLLAPASLIQIVSPLRSSLGDDRPRMQCRRDQLLLVLRVVLVWDRLELHHIVFSLLTVSQASSAAMARASVALRG